MIAFNTKDYVLFNKIINNFLYVHIYEYNNDKGDILEGILPKYLFREQYKKSIRILDELYEWTSDEFIHEMKCFHEVLLYYFLKKMESIQDSNGSFFKKHYFKSTIHNDIRKVAKMEYKKALDDGEKEKLLNFVNLYYDVNFYFDILFIDLDFTFIEKIYNDFNYGTGIINKNLGINLDYYFDILPQDIRERYCDNHINMTGRICEFVSYIKNRISFGTASKLFWENSIPVTEDKIQIIIDNMLNSYFYNSGIDISREVRIGNGNVDFKVSNGIETILIEIKKAHNSTYLKKGFESQLLDYVHASNCDNAFYMIACFTDEDIRKYERFIRQNVYTKTYNMYINICCLDVRIKLPSSKR